MKTVMKKMFCLMLVAVLMVGVMPFQAFATETCSFCNGAAEHCTVCDACLVGLEGGCPNACLPAQPASANQPAPANQTAADSNTGNTGYHTVTVVLYNGSVVTNAAVADGTNLYSVISALVPTAPNHPDGWTFNGWADTADAPASNISAEAIVDENTTVYALWVQNLTPPPAADDNTAPNTVKLTAALNYDGAPASAEYYVAKDSKLADVVVNVTIPVREGYQFMGWTLAHNIAIADQIITTPTTIYANWAETSTNNQGGAADNTDGEPIIAYYNINVDGSKTNTPIKAFAAGIRMSEVLAELYKLNVTHPSVNTSTWFELEGWYKDRECKYRVDPSSTLTENNNVLYANWIQKQKYSVTLWMYTNGSFNNPVPVDIFGYAQDGWVTLSEVTAVANNTFKAGNSLGLSVYGPFDYKGWENYRYYNNRLNGSQQIKIDTTTENNIYIMVHNVLGYKNATTTNSTSKADKTNPKTGDMIMMPAAVLGLSTASLAALYYVSKKKRAM